MQYDIRSNLVMNNLIMKEIKKTAILIAVYFNCFVNYAQTYNNWLLPGGVILNFDKSPATILCNQTNENDICKSSRANYPVCLSDEHGNVIIYGYKKEGETPNTDYVIKKADKTEIASFKALEVRNAIGCKLPQGGYYIAAVFVTTEHFKQGELQIYKLDKSGNLENKYVFSDSNYGFLLDYYYIDNYIALITYRKNQIVTYKLTSEGCELWSTSDITLDKYTVYPTLHFNIVHTIDNTKTIVTSRDRTYILKLDKNNGEVSIVNNYYSDKLRIIALSSNDKYLLSIFDNKLNGFSLNNSVDWDLDNPDIVYDLPKENETISHEWEMALGIDNKLYIHNQNTNYIEVLDGIESGQITKERINSNCLELTTFPQIPRQIAPETETITVCPSATKKYSVESPEAGYTYHWNVSGGTLSNDTGTETTVTWNNTEGEGTLSVYAEESLTGCKSDITEYKVHRQKAPSAQFDNAQVCNGEPLKIILNGKAPYNIFYTFNGENKTITTSNTEYQMDNIAGRYQITKVADQFCETSIKENNTAEILPKLNKLTIKTNNE